MKSSNESSIPLTLLLGAYNVDGSKKKATFFVRIFFPIPGDFYIRTVFRCAEVNPLLLHRPCLVLDRQVMKHENRSLMHIFPSSFFQFAPFFLRFNQLIWAFVPKYNRWWTNLVSRRRKVSFWATVIQPKLKHPVKIMELWGRFYMENRNLKYLSAVYLVLKYDWIAVYLICCLLLRNIRM